jgi:hypothetical protein
MQHTLGSPLRRIPMASRVLIFDYCALRACAGARDSVIAHTEGEEAHDKTQIGFGPRTMTQYEVCVPTEATKEMIGNLIRLNLILKSLVQR